MMFWRSPKAFRMLLTAFTAASALLVTVTNAQVPESASSSSAEEDGPITPIPESPQADARKLALGERLFGDMRLSAGERLSCATCHDVTTNGAYVDHKQPKSGRFDVPTVFNAALSYRLTWTGKFRTLSEQARASIEDPSGMSGKLEEIVPKLRADRALDEAFREAYGRPIGSESIVDALVTFEKSLLTPGSRFDKWLQGDASAITATELEGYPIESADYRRSVRSIAVLRST